jgi:hypothetical protein
MADYMNRPPIADDTPVWRYQSLAAAVATIKTLRLTRVDQFKDPFEGSVPKAQIDQQAVLFIGAESRRTMMNRIMPNNYADFAHSIPPADEDSWTRTTRLRRARTRSAHASCWSAGEESELLWRLYATEGGQPGVGVALQTTVARLEASVTAHDLYVSPIKYIRYHEAQPFTDEMDALLHKRHGFETERELRLLKFDQAHFGALVPKDASVPELPEHLCLDWVFRDAVEKIVISPYGDEDYERLVRETIKARDPDLADRVELSVLNERRTPAYF